ncbi:MAG: pitrilysin family protein, partial [Acidobacteriota bacterium]
RTLSTAYLWHNYGKSTIGARSDIENVPIDRLQAFYKKYYQPDNAVLMVSGKIDEAKTLELVNKYFGPIPRPDRVLPKIYTAEPVQDGERTVTLRRTGDTQLAFVSYHTPPGSHADFAPLSLLSVILGDTPSGRLHKALVETKKASSIFGFDFQQKEPGVSLFGAEVRTADPLDAARDALIETIEGFAASPPSKEEVERARTQLLKNIDLTLNASNRIGLAMSEWIAMGDWRLFFIHRDRLRKVTPEDVQRAAAKYLKPSNRTLGLFIPTAKPDRSEVPLVGDEEIAAMVKDYKGEKAMAAGEAFDPSPANIESRAHRSELPSGLSTAMLAKKTRGEAVFSTMVFRFGDEKSLMNRGTAASLAGQMLMRGTARHTRAQIQDEFDKLKARVFLFGGPTSAQVGIETVRQNLPAVLRLVAEVLREPSFPEKEFELLKQEELTGIESQKSEPGFIASVAMGRHLNPYPKGDPRYTATAEEQVEAIKATTLDDVKKFYRDFYGASNAQVGIAGDFDEKEISALIAELFGSWKSPRPYARLVSTYREIAPINQSFEAPDKANAFFVAGVNLKLRDDDPDYPALVLGNYMLGGGFLNSRLAVRIRQKDGLSYGVGSGLNASSLDQTGSFNAFAIYAPQNAEKLEAAFREEIARMLKDGFTAEEVAAAKSGFLQSRQVGRAQDLGLARSLASYLFLKRTLAWDEEFEKKIAALTPDQINAAMRRWIDPAKITIIKAGDFAKAKAAKQ